MLLRMERTAQLLLKEKPMLLRIEPTAQLLLKEEVMVPIFGR